MAEQHEGKVAREPRGAAALAAEEEALRSSRRGFLKGLGVAAGAVALVPAPGRAQQSPSAPAEKPNLRKMGRAGRTMTLRVNGKDQQITAEPRTTLLDALRFQLELTGCKEICDRGSCGGCTVLVDGDAVNSCMTLAVDVEGQEVTTVEGLAGDPAYKALFEGYYENDGAQCGYCIPGFVVQSAAFLKANPGATSAQLREGIAGNICRCGTYSKIFDSLDAAVKKGGVA